MSTSRRDGPPSAVPANKPIQSRPKRAGAGIKSLRPGLRILEILVDNSEPLSLNDIAREAKLTPSTTRRYLITLVSTNMVAQDPDTRRYGLGGAAARLGVVALGRSDHLARAISCQGNLQRELGETTILSVWAGSGPIVYNVLHSYAPIYLDVRVGTSLPLSTSAAGLVFAAFMPRPLIDPLMDEEIREHQLNAPRSAAPGSWPEVDARIEDVRTTRLAIVEHSLIDDAAAAAVPLIAPTGRLVASLAVLISHERFEQRQERVGATLRRTARDYAKYLDSEETRTWQGGAT